MRPTDDDFVRIQPVKLPKKGGTRKFASPNANRKVLPGRYYGTWTRWNEHEIDLFIIPAVDWLNANATGNWQYRCEYGYSSLRDPQYPNYSPYFVRHFIHYDNPQDIMLMKLST